MLFNSKPQQTIFANVFFQIIENCFCVEIHIPVFPYTSVFCTIEIEFKTTGCFAFAVQFRKTKLCFRYPFTFQIIVLLLFSCLLKLVDYSLLIALNFCMYFSDNEVWPNIL